MGYNIMTPLEIKVSIKESLSGLVEHILNWNREGYTDEINEIKDALYSLVVITNRLVDIVEVPPDTTKEQLSLNAAPFQPECRCKVIRESDGSLTLHHCDYHKSIEFIHSELKALLVEISMGKSESELRKLIRNDIAFLDGYKTTSLTGRIGKVRDENVGR